MKQVYRCHKKFNDGEDFAVKIINNKKLNPKMSKRQQAQIRKEAQILKTFTSEYITKLEDNFEHDQQLYLVMELVPYGELFDEIVDHQTSPYNSRFY